MKRRDLLRAAAVLPVVATAKANVCECPHPSGEFSVVHPDPTRSTDLERLNCTYYKPVDAENARRGTTPIHFAPPVTVAEGKTRSYRQCEACGKLVDYRLPEWSASNLQRTPRKTFAWRDELGRQHRVDSE